VDKAQRCVFVNDADREHVPVRYDYLILATGARHSYFGHKNLKSLLRMKSLADASYSKQNPRALRAAEAEEM